ncbi:DUF6477 family protein [Seohaeicola saemankumensis]|nr:DUF6477 family protein [Seohaeicola saemankumensis]MCA0872123.1 DUF6477 family protein [Seohaeicola saemankumensis]
MQDVLSMLRDIHRPRLLIRAARLGAREYRRDRHLQRLLGYGQLPRPGAALMRLMELERGLNDMRVDDDAGYSLPRHLDVLIAIMGEAGLMQATRPNLAALT